MSNFTESKLKLTETKLLNKLLNYKLFSFGKS